MFSRNELIQRYSKATNRSNSALTDRLHSHQQLIWTDGLTPRDRNAILISQTAQFWKEVTLFASFCKGCSLARVAVSPSGPQLRHFTPHPLCTLVQGGHLLTITDGTGAAACVLFLNEAHRAWCN